MLPSRRPAARVSFGRPGALAAEVARLEGLGARVKARIRNHVVMEAPSGHAFCVVPVQRKDFPAGATEWP